MRCSYGASFPEPADQIWASLADVDGYLAARPGVTLARDGDGLSGSIKCTLGSGQVTYRLSVSVTVAASEPHTAVIVVTGREARGTGTLGASLTAVLRTEGSGSRLEISGDIQATGRGEAADEEAWSRVLSRLLDPQVESVVESPGPDRPTEAASPVTAAPPRPALSVAPDVDDWAAAQGRRKGPPPQVIVGMAVAVLLLLRRRRRARRRTEGGPDVER